MKKSILLLLFGITFYLQAKSQKYVPFPTDSAQWYCSYSHFDEQSFTGYSYYLRLKGDTLINGNVYSKVYYSYNYNYSSTDESLQCFIREDQKKIYAKYPYSNEIQDTTEFVLYDFNLKLNDTIAVKHVDIFGQSKKFIVDSLKVFFIDSAKTNISYRKRYNLGLINEQNQHYSLSDSWTEGIGSNQSLLHNQYFGMGPINYFLNCFSIKGEYIRGNKSCETLGIENYSFTESSGKIYPNPVKDEVLFEWAKPDYSTLQLYNLMGKKVFEAEINHKTQIQVNTKQFGQGIFLYRLSDKNGNRQTGKFIVQ